MKVNDMSDEQFSTAVEEVLKARNYQTAAWDKVKTVGRQYAQMKTMCSYIENGVCRLISRSEQTQYTEVFKRNLLRAVEDAFLEDAVVGGTLNN